MNLRKYFIALFVTLFTVMGSHAFADVYNMGSTAYFVTSLTETPAATMNFGTIAAGASDTFTVPIPNGSAQTYTTTITTSGNVLHIIKSAGSVGAIKITGSGQAGTTLTVNVISGSGYTPNMGVTASNAQCSYDGAAAFACETGATNLAAPGSAGKYLRVGADITPDGIQNADGMTATPSIAINISYT